VFVTFIYTSYKFYSKTNTTSKPIQLLILSLKNVTNITCNTYTLI